MESVESKLYLCQYITCPYWS